MFRSIVSRTSHINLVKNKVFLSSKPGVIYYTKSHEWVKEVNNSLRIGITHHAQRELGDISFIVPPIPGKTYNQDEETVVIESTKAVGEIKMPVTGTIVEVNKRLDEEPKLINDDPEGEGWIFSFSGSSNDKKFLGTLMNEKDYQEHLKSLKK